MLTISDLIDAKKREAAAGPMTSAWMEIDQARIDLFARATNDLDPLHIDPDYARTFSPYGSTIAFGFLTMSLLTHLYRSSTAEHSVGYALNYGFDRLRLPSVVPVNARIRGVFQLKSIEDRGNGKVLFRYDVHVEVEGSDRPALVAEWLAMWVEDGVSRPGADYSAGVQSISAA